MSRTKDWLMGINWKPEDNIPPDDEPTNNEPINITHDEIMQHVLMLSSAELSFLCKILPYNFSSSRPNANKAYDSLREKVFRLATNYAGQDAAIIAWKK